MSNDSPAIICEQSATPAPAAPQSRPSWVPQDCNWNGYAAVCGASTSNSTPPPAPQPAPNKTAVTAPPFDPSKPYEVVGPPAAPIGLYQQLAAAEDQEIAWTNSHAPIKLKGPIKETHASRVESLITIEYEIAFPADKWTDDHRSDLTRITTTENCDDKKTREMLDAGFKVRHVFRDQSGVLAYSITITKYNCSQASN